MLINEWLADKGYRRKGGCEPKKRSANSGALIRTTGGNFVTEKIRYFLFDCMFSMRVQTFILVCYNVIHLGGTLGCGVQLKQCLIFWQARPRGGPSLWAVTQKGGGGDGAVAAGHHHANASFHERNREIDDLRALLIDRQRAHGHDGFLVHHLRQETKTSRQRLRTLYTKHLPTHTHTHRDALIPHLVSFCVLARD